jgi:2-isopropylmalate synthase
MRCILCLRKGLASVCPRAADVRLTDYKVRVLEPGEGTAAGVRVLIGCSDHRKSWCTVGVSENGSWRVGTRWRMLSGWS